MRTGEISAIIDLNENDEALRPLTENRPIGTLPFAGRYRMIDFPLSAIANSDIHSVGIFLPRSARSVQDHIRSGATWNLDLIQGGVFMFPYVATRDYEDNALRQRYYDDYMQFLRKSGSRYTVIVGGQIVANLNINALLAYHQAGDSPITVAYKNIDAAQMAPDDLALALSLQGTAGAIVPASELRLQKDARVPAYMPVTMIDTVTLLDLLDDARKQPRFRRLPDLLRTAVLDNNANAFEYTGYLARINTMKRYYDANMSMLDEVNYQSLLFSSVPIMTKAKNEVPSYFTNESQVVNSLLGTGAYIEGNVHDSIVFRNVTVHRDAEVANSIVMQGAKISAGSTVRYAVLDKGVVIGPNLTIEGTPEVPVVVAKNETVYTNEGVKAHG